MGRGRTSISEANVEAEHWLQQRIGTPEPRQKAGESREQSDQPAIAIEDASKKATKRFTRGWLVLRPELVKELQGATDAEGSPAGFPEVGWVKVVCDRVGQEDDLETVLHLQPIAELDVFHHRAVEPFVEGAAFQELRFDREIAGVEVFPIRRNTSQEVAIGELDSTAIEPSH